MIKKIYKPTKDLWPTIFKRPQEDLLMTEATVNKVFTEVKRKGDRAVKKYTKRFDRVELKDLLVSDEEIKKASGLLDGDLKAAIALARDNIEKFHAAQRTEKVEVETSEGVNCWLEKRPIGKVGLYIPGGTAPLFSTVLMLAIPAKLAGCREIVLCSPPGKEGQLHPAILYTASLCGVTKIFKTGGIQAIAAMCFGTESIPKVFKIFGPGNQFVTAAKQKASRNGTAIDMPAGPSELLIVADSSAKASFVASDLLSQAEHGVDSQVFLLSTSKNLLLDVEREIEEQIKELPRKEIILKALENSALILVSTGEQALELANNYAPEHLIIINEDEDYFVNGIQNAGSVFLGNYTPESAGDYASGTNHTLPTNGFSKAYSGVNLDSFLKGISFQKNSKIGIQNIGNSIEIMAEAEGLMAHKNAVSIRLKNIEDEKF